MQVSLSPVHQSNPSFQARKKSAEKTNAATKQQKIIDAKTKKAVSECFYVAVGFAFVYMVTKVQAKRILADIKAKKDLEIAKLAHSVLEPILPTAENIPKKIGISKLA